MTVCSHLTCCICGGDAGKFEQHFNRDTGYGICPRCVSEEAGRNTSERLQALYGKPGVNYRIPRVRHYDRLFKVLALFPETDQGTKDANAFMERTPGASVLCVAGGVYLADAADKGELATAQVA